VTFTVVVLGFGGGVGTSFVGGPTPTETVTRLGGRGRSLEGGFSTDISEIDLVN